MAGHTLNVGGKADATGILLKLRVVETLLERQSAGPGFVLGRVLVFIDVDGLVLNLVNGALFYMVGERDSTHPSGKKPRGAGVVGCAAGLDTMRVRRLCVVCGRLQRSGKGLIGQLVRAAISHDIKESSGETSP